MKRFSLPTLAGIATALGAVIVRFPGTILAAGAGVGAAITLAELEGADTDAHWQMGRVLIVALLALPLTLALRLAAEARGCSRARGLLLDAAGLAAALAYGLGLPSSLLQIHQALFIRTAILVLGMHFLVALAPALRPGGGEAAFWEFNWRLFLRFWLAALYSAVLFVGLALAVGSASRLFDLKIKPERYAELWIVIVGLFNTCFFVHGVPRAGGGGAATPDYPRGLRMFAQVALAPLVVAYLAILYPYAAKIALLRAWPNGWVSLPILCLAVAGILAALLLHPIREKPEERWAAWYWRWFFRAFLPLTVLLYLAVRVRIDEYGITESRYFGLVLAGWLALVSIYFWWPANRSIRWLPASLALICLGCTWGPWGAFAVSEHSQFARLQAKLAAHGLLVDGVLTPKPQDFSQKDYTDLQSMLRYLRSRHASAQLSRLLAPWHAAAGAKAATGTRSNAMDAAWSESGSVLTWLGVRRTEGSPGWFNVQIDGAGEVKGYATARVIWQVNRGAAEEKAPGSGPRFELDRKSGALIARTAAGRLEVKAVTDLLAKAAAEPHGTGSIRLPWDRLSAAVTLDGKDYLLVVLQTAGRRTNEGRVELNSLTLMVLAR
jgi:hypothetical protein